MKYLYVLTSCTDDLYFEQLYLSVNSLLLYNPDAYITLLVDDTTYARINSQRTNFLKYIQEIKIVEFPNCYSQKVKSRLLKTSMRNQIDGDFLYLDCDTIILSKINIPRENDFDIGAVFNLHFENVEESPVFPIVHYMASASGIQIDSKKYYNSGVLYVKDNITTRNFFSCWHKQYLFFLNKKGIEVDQLSLYKTNNDFNGLIHKLPDEFNWQVGFGINIINNAVIMHTFSSVSNHVHNIHFLKRKEIYERIKAGKIEDSELRTIIVSANTSFDNNVRIVPNDSFINNEQSLFDFCERFHNIVLYGSSLYFLKALFLIKKRNYNVLGVIPTDEQLRRRNYTGYSIYELNKLKNAQDVGIILAMDIQEANSTIPLLIKRGIVNLFILN